MTNEEIKVVLKSLADNPLLSAEHITKALYKAIELVESQPCEDCVNRDALINELKCGYWDKNLQSAKNDPCIVDAMIDWSIRTVKSQPSVTPQPNTGEWRHYERTITCSECDTEFYDDIMEYCGDDVPRFCPHCGARMNGGGEE